MFARTHLIVTVYVHCLPFYLMKYEVYCNFWLTCDCCQKSICICNEKQGVLRWSLNERFPTADLDS